MIDNEKRLAHSTINHFKSKKIWMLCPKHCINCIVAFSVWQMPFYFTLTMFRVLSISIAIVALQWICSLVFPVLLLTIIVIGYKKTSRGKDFLTRGLISALTTGMLWLILVANCDSRTEVVIKTLLQIKENWMVDICSSPNSLLSLLFQLIIGFALNGSSKSTGWQWILCS